MIVDVVVIVCFPTESAVFGRRTPLVHPTGALSPKSVAELMSDPLFAEMRRPRQTGCGGINMHLTEACPNVL